MDSGFNITDSFFASFEGEYVEIGHSRRFRYSKTRIHGELLFVKEPTQEYSHDLITIEALKKEFLLGFSLNHPGIVRYYSLENNRLLEEYIEGKTLRQLLDEDDLRLYKKEFVRDLTRQILEALKYIHAKGIAHLDLKPENIIVTNLGNRIKIIDLSCAENLSGYCTPGYTQEYQAPEQISGQGNISTDIYQLGLILREITQGKREERKWKKFISKSTANHPDNRFSNAEEALKALPSETKFNYKWISAIFISIIAGGVIAIIVKDPIVHKTEKEDTFQVEDLSAAENPQNTSGFDKQQKQINLPDSKIYQSNDPTHSSTQEIERNLSKMIEKKLDALFSVKVTPMYEKMMADKTYKEKDGISKEFIDSYSKELDRVMAYGEELKTEYPDQSFFIEERIVRTFETKTSKMLSNLYSRQDMQPVRETENVVSPEDVDSIHRN